MTTNIKPRLPRREWLLRCTDNDNDLSTCAICVNDGAIEIISADHTIIGLQQSQIAEFHEAFQSALALADADLSARPRPSGIPDM